MENKKLESEKNQNKKNIRIVISVFSIMFILALPTLRSIVIEKTRLNLSGKIPIEMPISEVCSSNHDYVTVRGNITFPDELEIKKSPITTFQKIQLNDSDTKESLDVYFIASEDRAPNRANKVLIYFSSFALWGDDGEHVNHSNLEITGYVDHKNCELYALQFKNFENGEFTQDVDQ